MHLLDVVRKTAGGLGGSGPTEDSSKSSSRAALQTLRGFTQAVAERTQAVAEHTQAVAERWKQDGQSSMLSDYHAASRFTITFHSIRPAPEPVRAVQVPVAVGSVFCSWRSDGMPIAASKHLAQSWVVDENGQPVKHEQEGGSHGSNCHKPPPEEKESAEPPEDSSKQSTKNSIREAMIGFYGMVRKQNEEDACSALPEVVDENGHEHKRKGGSQDASNKSAGYAFPWNPTGKTQAPKELPVFEVTKPVSYPAYNIQMPVSSRMLECSWRSDSSASENGQVHEQSSGSDGDSEEDDSKSNMERVRDAIGNISLWPSDSKMEQMEAGLDKVANMIVSDKVANGFAKVITRTSEVIKDKGKRVLARGESLQRIVEEPSSESTSPSKAEPSAMASALRNRGGAIPNQDGFEAFYGIENENEDHAASASANGSNGARPEIGERQDYDDIDSPRDGFDDFYGVYDEPETPPKTVAPVPRMKLAPVPSLSLGLGSLEKLKDAGKEDAPLSARESDVPNYSLDTFRRVL